LDFALSAGIFLPWRSIVTISLGYAFGWGLVTALARIISHFYRAIPLHSIEQWGHETVFRLPHALIPLIILIIISSRKN
jgi:heme/copper-type cytochrome/quinol oxidase subunit 2